MNVSLAMPECDSAADPVQSCERSQETPDAFADAVRDILMERWPHIGQHADDVEDVTALITDAYVPRIRRARQRADMAEVEMRTLVERDHAIHEVLTQVKTSARLFLDGQTRERVVRNQLDHILRRMRELVVQAAAEGSSTLELDRLSAVLDTGVYVPEPAVPVVIAVRPDHRYRLGVFTGLDGQDGRLFRFAFVGWSVVLRGDADADVEPCFLVDGQVVARSAISARGLNLHHLVPAAG